MRPILFDLFCCGGGAAMGYHQAGFDVVGFDIEPQPHYPFPFVQMDVMRMEPWYITKNANAVHASPPCQKFTKAQRLMKNKHPDLIAPTRQLLRASGLHYVIENVEGAPLVDPFMLCGAMFGLRTYRHRIFETTFPVQLPGHPPHTAKTTKMGRAPKTGEMMHVVGHFSGVKEAREAMGIDWGTRETLREAIPPVYTKWIGSQMPV